MKKIFIFVQFVVLLTAVFSSCSDSKTYAELLSEEKDAISKFIADSGYVVINNFEGDSLYNPATKKLVRMSNGMYLAIINKGSKTDTAVPYVTKVTYRFKLAKVLTGSDTSYISNYYNFRDAYPNQFIYKAQATTQSYHYTSGTTMLCEAIQLPITFLGNGAIVKMIIPSKISFTDYQSSVKPLYISELKYTFSKQD